MITRSFRAYGFETGKNSYSIIKITQNTNEECMQELFKQISHGFFENARTDNKED